MSNPAEVPTTFGNVFEDVLEVFWSPSAVFDRARNRGFGKYMLVVTLLTAVVVAVVASLLRPWLDATFDLQIQMAAKAGQAMPENAVAAARKFGSVGFYFTPVFLGVLGPLFMGALLLLGGKLVQAPVRYGQAVLIATLATVPRVLSFVVSAIQALVMDAEKARSLYDLTAGPARFLDPGSVSPTLLQLVASLDLFNVWQLVLFGLGVAAMAKVAKSTGFIAGLVAWVLGTALPLLPTLLRP
jgi:hypothetical protein